jgi:hypothetical protein
MVRSSALGRLFFVLLALTVPRSLQAQGYHLEELGPLGGNVCAALALKAPGQTVGWTEGVLGRAGSHYKECSLAARLRHLHRELCRGQRQVAG